MKLISTLELNGRNERELSELFAEISRKLIRTERGSPERRNGLASLENIATMRGYLARPGPLRR